MEFYLLGHLVLSFILLQYTQEYSDELQVIIMADEENKKIIDDEETDDESIEVTPAEEKEAEEELEKGGKSREDTPSEEEEHETEDLEKEVKQEEKELDESTAAEKEKQKEAEVAENSEDIDDISEKDVKMKKSEADEVEDSEDAAPLENVIFTLRTTVGRESTVVDLLNTKLKPRNTGVKSILHPAELKGYVFIEGSENGIREGIKGVPHIRGLIDRPVKLDELKRFFAEDLPQIHLKEGEIVEVIGGPFKREKAKIVRMDETKREAKIELIESAVPIPITISLDLLKATRER